MFWSAPLALDSDFTAEDPLALDYLGQQVGLWLFRGFTTRTSRAQNYAVVLYGLNLVRPGRAQVRILGDDETRTRLLERWERFWALATLEFRNGNLVVETKTQCGGSAVRRALVPRHEATASRFPLISRQNELGGLGAYLTSLREYGLVFPGSLRVTQRQGRSSTLSGQSHRERDWSHLYQEYALSALDRSGGSPSVASVVRLTLGG